MRFFVLMLNYYSQLILEQKFIYLLNTWIIWIGC